MKAHKVGLILYNSDHTKILIAHPTLASSKKTEHNYDIPKGTVEEGEDLLSALKRECDEEIGFVPDNISHLFDKDYGGKTIRYYTATVTESDEEVLAKCVCKSTFSRYGKDWPELEKFEWCEIAEAVNTRLYKNHTEALKGEAL